MQESLSLMMMMFCINNCRHRNIADTHSEGVCVCVLYRQVMKIFDLCARLATPSMNFHSPSSFELSPITIRNIRLSIQLRLYISRLEVC